MRVYAGSTLRRRVVNSWICNPTLLRIPQTAFASQYGFAISVDTVDHGSLFHALHHQGIDNEHIALIASLCKSQSKSVNRRRGFSVGRGVKQGDVLSTLLFHGVSNIAFHRFRVNFAITNLFINDSQSRVANIRYADHILLFSNSLGELIAISEMFLR